MKGAFKIILDKSTPSDDGSCRVLNFQSLSDGFVEMGYHKYVFGATEVFTKEPLTEEQIAAYEKEEKEQTEKMVKELSDSIDKEILNEIWKRQNEIPTLEPVVIKDISECPESALELLYSHRFIETDAFGHQLPSEPYDSYKTRYRVLFVDSVIYLKNTDSRSKPIKRMVKDGVGMFTLSRYFDATVMGAKVIKNRFGTIS